MSMSARTLVLLPGLMCDEAVWAPSLSGLPAGWEPWVADSGLCNSLQAMAEAVLAGAPQGPFALAGHSMGGRVALEVVRVAPQRVSHLALLDTGHTPRAAGEAGAEEARKRYALLELARTQGVRTMAQTWVQGMVAPDRLHGCGVDRADRGHVRAQKRRGVCGPDPSFAAPAGCQRGAAQRSRADLAAMWRARRVVPACAARSHACSCAARGFGLD